MGAVVSHASAAAPPPPPTGYAPFVDPAAAAAPPPAEKDAAADEEKVDYMNLPCPVPYEEIQREAFMSLKPDVFEGLRFDFTKMLNPFFGLSHRFDFRFPPSSSLVFFPL
jgi:mitochondrial import receptor subunit TOM40